MSIARACANIALVKYWGKRDRALNLPAAGSLSLTLDALATRTLVEVSEGENDELVLDGAAASGKALDRVVRFLDLVRGAAGGSSAQPKARVTTSNVFPTAAGLASSASGFAALAVAAADAYGLRCTPRELSALARRGSGSAARSIFGGFVKMDAGVAPDGSDAVARPLEGSKIELSAAIAVVRAPAKAVGSSEGMERTRETSPYHASWIALVDRDLAACEAALWAGDFEALAAVVEGSCLAMHADAMAARPGIIYFAGATSWAIDRVRKLRAGGTPVTFTVDAGPHLVAFTSPAHLAAVASALGEHPDVERVLTSAAGPGAAIVG